MLKMVMITYNEAIDMEVMEILQGSAVKNYTKVVCAFGRGTTSGIHQGDDVWPGRNNILYIACDDKQSKLIVGRVKELRKTLGKEGVKAFVMPLEEIT